MEQNETLEKEVYVEIALAHGENACPGGNLSRHVFVVASSGEMPFACRVGSAVVTYHKFIIIRETVQ